jgi:hypothetical protein
MGRKYILITGALILSFIMGVSEAGAEVLTGHGRGDWAVWEKNHDLAPQGRFFSNTDFAYKPGEKDEYKLELTRGLITGAAPAGSIARLFHEPWISGKERTLFGVAFDRELTGKFLPDKRPLKFDRILITWGAQVPAPGSWGGFIITDEGKIVDLPVEKDKKLYPYDKTEIKFDPVTIKKLYFAKKGAEDGLPDNYLEISGLHVFFHEESGITNYVTVWQPDWYVCSFDTKSPGCIAKILPMSEFFNISPGAAPLQHFWIEGPLRNLRPVVTVDGKELSPLKKSYTFTKKSKDNSDTLSYTLDFELPGGKGIFSADVTAVFKRSAEDSVKMTVKPGKDFPAGAVIGFRAEGGKDFLGPVFSGKPDVSIDLAKRAVLGSAAGEIVLSAENTPKLEAKLSGEYYLLDARGLPGKEASLTIGLPVFESAKTPPVSHTVFNAPAARGPEGLAPFQPEDLELLETIDCGNPGDPHKFYDISNDPRVSSHRQIFTALVKPRVQMLPAILCPDKGKVPVSDVLGRKCRDIGDYYGAYFRYELKTDFERDTQYLLVFEHAFDKERRGAVEISDSGRMNCGVLSGLDTGVFGHSGSFKRESILFNVPHYVRPRAPDEFKKPFSVWVANTWLWHGWIKAPGPAVSKIEIHKVKRMPQTFGLTKLLPPENQRRHAGYHTQSFRPEFFRSDNQVTGLDSVWLNNSAASVLTSGMGWRSPYPIAGSFHPGTFDGYQKALALAEKNGAIIKTYLAQVLHWGMEGSGHDSFGGYAEDHYATYNWEDIPLAPSADEFELVSKALAKALPALLKHKSLQYLCMADPTGRPFTFRNIRDFTKETGIKVEPVPWASHEMKNAKILLDAGPETVAAWTKWACEKRAALHKRLLAEIRKHGPSLFLMLNANWTREYLDPYWSSPSDFFLSKEKLAERGIKSYPDYLRFRGWDPALYKGVDGMAFQIHAGGPAITLFANNDRPETIGDKPGPRAPDFTFEPWMRDIAESFSSGLNYSLSINSEESPKPWSAHCAYCFKNGLELKKSMTEALLLNARFVDLETYGIPWRGRIAEIREFAVPFRLLPFTKPEAPEAKLVNASGSLILRKHADRHALINASDKAQNAIIEPLPGKDSVTDLSSGAPERLKTTVKDGKKALSVPLEPWSFKVLTFSKGE